MGSIDVIPHESHAGRYITVIDEVSIEEPQIRKPEALFISSRLGKGPLLHLLQSNMILF